MTELHDALGAVWVGHDYGSLVVCQLAAGEETGARCHAVINLNVPYIPAGFGVEVFCPLSIASSTLRTATPTASGVTSSSAERLYAGHWLAQEQLAEVNSAITSG